MIGRLRGIILEKQPPLVLLEVGGVGYEVHMPMTCFYELPEQGNEATVFTQFVVREDAQLLYGFNNKQERTLFRELIKTNGVGPKLALAILSGMSAAQFVNAVEREDSVALVKLPGIGKKNRRTSGGRNERPLQRPARRPVYPGVRSGADLSGQPGDRRRRAGSGCCAGGAGL